VALPPAVAALRAVLRGGAATPGGSTSTPTASCSTLPIGEGMSSSTVSRGRRS
jgi:hypothetical protein